MTDRSSQPTSSEDNQQVSVHKVGARRFTVTLTKSTATGQLNATTSEDTNSQASSSTSSTSSSKGKLEGKLGGQVLSAGVAKKTTSPTTQAKSLPKFPQIPKHIDYPDSHKPAVVHALFDPKRIKIDPARPLTDIPEPAPRQVLEDESTSEMFARFKNELSQKNIHADTQHQSHDNTNKKTAKQPQATTSTTISTTTATGYIAKTNTDKTKHKPAQAKAIAFDKNASKWELIKSPDLADHLDLLSAGGLAKLPKSFYHNSSVQPLLTSIADMTLVDMSQIQATIDQLSNTYKSKGILTRQGFIPKRKLTAKNKLTKLKKQLKEEGCKKEGRKKEGLKKEDSLLSRNLPSSDSIHNLELAYDWESILYPERFDSDEMGYSNLSTDIMATSVSLHALQQCPTRKSINDKLTATDIAKYLRSYLLSQCNQLPHRKEHLKHIHIYAGHVIIVAKMLGWQMEYVTTGKNKGEMIFNVSSRCGLFIRYPLLSAYYTNGWHG